MEPTDFEPMAPHLREPDLEGIGYLSFVSKPRDPVERELLRQQGDPVALREDPGWIRLAGTRAIRQPLPFDVEATQAWLQEEQTLDAVDTWVRQRTALRQRVTSVKRHEN